MPDVNLDTVGLVSTLRTAPLNGSPSSSDYNEGQRETLVDLAALAGFINNTVLPLINALSADALLPITAPVGIEGRTIWSDTSDQGPIFFDALATVPLSLADSLRVINGIVSTNSQQLTDLGVEVASLQARLSSTNQNDIALALQNLSSSLNSIIVGQTDSNASIAALQVRVTAVETGVATLNSDITTINSSLSAVMSFDTTADARITALENDKPYDITVFSPGTGITSSQVLLRVNVIRTFTLPISLTGSKATAITGPAGSTTITIKKNGSSIGSFTYGTSATTASFTFASAVTFNANDVLDFVSATTDADITGIAVTLAGSHS